MCDTNGYNYINLSQRLDTSMECDILPDWHSVAFRQNTELEVEALVIENCCKGGS